MLRSLYVPKVLATREASKITAAYLVCFHSAGKAALPPSWAHAEPPRSPIVVSECTGHRRAETDQLHADIPCPTVRDRVSDRPNNAECANTVGTIGAVACHAEAALLQHNRIGYTHLHESRCQREGSQNSGTGQDGAVVVRTSEHVVLVDNRHISHARLSHVPGFVDPDALHASFVLHENGQSARTVMRGYDDYIRGCRLPGGHLMATIPTQQRTPIL